MNVVAPFGFYGWGNIGDEATLQGFARLLRGYSRPIWAWVASQNPRHTAHVEPSFRYYRYQGGIWGLQTRCITRLARAYVFPGGTPIMDGLGAWPLCEVVPIVRHAQRSGKPVVFVGSGIESLQRPESGHLVSETLASYVAHWSVRSARDRERLVASGVSADRITAAADVAWLIPPVSVDFGLQALQRHELTGHRLVGVNVNAENALVEREPKLFEKLASVLDELVEAHHVRVVFLCNEVREDETFDKAAATEVKRHMRHQNETFLLPNEYWAPQQMMSVIASCCLTMSTRYHFCLFSALQGVPFLAIKRSDKVADLCEDLGWTFGAVPGSIDVDTLSQQATMLLKDASSQMRDLSGRVAAMRERAWLNKRALDIMHARASAMSSPYSLRTMFKQASKAT